MKICREECLEYWSVCNSCPEYVTPSEMSAYTYSKEEIDEKISSGGTCCCPQMVVEGTTLKIVDADECVYVVDTTLVIGNN